GARRLLPSARSGFAPRTRRRSGAARHPVVCSSPIRSVPMTDTSRLEASLRTLRSELATLEVGDDAARQRLDALVGELETALAHPGLAGVVNEVVQSLGNMGI